jgi:hypothetical protein
MRVLKIAVMAVAVATALGVGLGPALADPPPGVTPKLTDVVGVGSQTTQGVLDAIAASYDASLPAASPHLYSWDAVDPVTGAVGLNITPKAGCAPIARPDGTGAGVTALATTGTVKFQGKTYPCINYARASSPPSSTSPAGFAWVGYAEDAVTWVTTTKAKGLPHSLSAAELNKIYSANTGACLTWADVGGKGPGSTSTIVPALPQTSSGTRAFFLAAIGVVTPGTCTVNGAIDIPGDSMNPVPLEENTGVSGTSTGASCTSKDYAACTSGNTYFFAMNTNALYPYSAADWIAQGKAPSGGGHASALFGRGLVTEPGAIVGPKQAETSPITTGSPDTINTKFATGVNTGCTNTKYTVTTCINFTRYVFNVTPNAGNATVPKLPTTDTDDLVPYFSGPGNPAGQTAAGAVCKNTAILKSWGFLPLPVPSSGVNKCGFMLAG